MEASIVMPIAAVIPPKVTRSRLEPLTHNARSVKRIDKGIAKLIINVVLLLCKNINKIITAKNAPKSAERMTDLMDMEISTASSLIYVNERPADPLPYSFSKPLKMDRISRLMCKLSPSCCLVTESIIESSPPEIT
jgi:hypothetical protein